MLFLFFTYGGGGGGGGVELTLALQSVSAVHRIRFSAESKMWISLLKFCFQYLETEVPSSAKECDKGWSLWGLCCCLTDRVRQASQRQASDRVWQMLIFVRPVSLSHGQNVTEADLCKACVVVSRTECDRVWSLWGHVIVMPTFFQALDTKTT